MLAQWGPGKGADILHRKHRNEDEVGSLVGRDCGSEDRHQAAAERLLLHEGLRAWRPPQARTNDIPKQISAISSLGLSLKKKAKTNKQTSPNVF